MNDADRSKRSIFKSNEFHHPSNPQLNAEQFLAIEATSLGLGAKDELIPMDTHKSKAGFTRLKYQQQYDGLKIYGGVYFLHERNNRIEKSSGTLYPQINLNTTPSLNLSSAVESAHEFALSEYNIHYKEIENIEVVNLGLSIIDSSFPDFSGNYRLTYQLMVEAEGETYPIKERVFVDAHTGKIVNHFTEICSTAQGKAKTRYYGERNITTDSIGPDEFQLIDRTRGDGIYTLNGMDRNTSADFNYNSFTDEDNYWDNFNEDFDEIAGDLHSCTSSYYDYMMEKFGWDGLDGEGGALVAIAHVNSRYYANAFWNGSVTSYGNGNCNRYGPLTTIDVVAHEFTHGHIDFGSDLVYQDESGALNESIADIFGKAVEKDYDPGNFTWEVGKRFLLDQTEPGIRSMSDPGLKNDPRFYHGENWEFGSSDRGGVHTNSGVFNHWFYLLVEGVSGTNEVGYEYDVPSIGWDKAIDIVYEVQRGFLTMSSNYSVALSSTVEYVKEVYGENSEEYLAVIEAWKAVGLELGFNDFDLALEEVVEEYFGCPDAELRPAVIVRNVGNNTYLPGQEISISYIINGATEIEESFELTDVLPPSDSVYYEFTTPITFDPDISRDLQLVLNNVDDIEVNNTLLSDIRFYENFGQDLVLRDFQFRVDDECNPTEIRSYRIDLRNDGCTPITEDDRVQLKVTTDLEEQTFEYLIYNDVEPGVNIISFRSFGGFSFMPGFTDFSAELIYEDDLTSDNNKVESQFGLREILTEDYEQVFDDRSFEQDFDFNIQTWLAQDSLLRYRGSERLAIATNRVYTAVNRCLSAEDFYDQNPEAASLEACINVTGMEDPVLSFDLVQMRNGPAIEDIDENHRSMVFVTTDSIDYPLIYGQENGRIVNHVLELTKDYQGPIEINSLVLSGVANTYDSGLDSLDVVMFDNIEIYDRATRPIIEVKDDFSVFPTATSSYINFSHPDPNLSFDVTLYSFLGEKLQWQSDFGFLEFDVSAYDSGTYIYVITSEGLFVESGKFLKAR